MARPIRIEYPGAVYHVITRGNNHQAIFKDERDRATYLEKLSYYCEEKEVELLCYCLLSNHVHLLLETPRGNLSKMMQPFQTSYTVYFNRRHRHTGHVFEQRYKAFLIDKDNYLLQVSRYIHLNPVGARIVERPQDYRWCSYGAYLKERKVAGLNRELILEQFEGKGQSRLLRYRDFVEGGLKRGEEWSKLPIIEQAFVGEEDFAEQAKKKAKKYPVIEGRYSLADIVNGVCKVMGVEREELSKASKEERVQRGREILMYIARRYSEASLREIVRYLGARDISTVSHGVRRAEQGLKEDRDFRNQVDQVLKKLSASRIQA
jgi:REP element-mobilizing transposase RayT